MAFQFISNKIGAEERRMIRSHVMMGKNARRAHLPRRRTKQNATRHAAIQANNIVAAETDLMASIPPSLYDRLISNDLAFAEIPQQSAESIEHLRKWLDILDRRLYPSEFCSRLDFMNYVWLQYAFYDEGYMHGVLAIKASFQNCYGTQVTASAYALEHLSRAHKCTQRRLVGPDAISDKAIAGVTILAIYHLVHGNVETGLVHFEGLCRMVRLRGGLGKLMRHNRALAQKPWRIDIEFALQSGSPMHFCGTEAALYTEKKLNPKVLHPAYTKLCYSGASIDLICILSDVAAFTNILNATDELNKLDPLDFSERAFQILNVLVDFAPLRETRPTHHLDDLLHLVLLAVMTTALPKYTANEVRYDLLARKLENAILRYTACPDKDGELLLWAIFVGRVSVLRGRQAGWASPVLLRVSHEVQAYEWSDIQRVLGRYCWIHSLHDVVAMKIWEGITSESPR